MLVYLSITVFMLTENFEKIFWWRHGKRNVFKMYVVQTPVLYELNFFKYASFPLLPSIFVFYTHRKRWSEYDDVTEKATSLQCTWSKPQVSTTSRTRVIYDIVYIVKDIYIYIYTGEVYNPRTSHLYLPPFIIIFTCNLIRICHIARYIYIYIYIYLYIYITHIYIYVHIAGNKYIYLYIYIYIYKYIYIYAQVVPVARVVPAF